MQPDKKRKMAGKIPVILDTDIGSDIDDTWALALLLKSPEVDLRLVVSDSFDTTYRAKLIAKMLEIAKRADIAIGIGIKGKEEDHEHENLKPWVEDYQLERYPGTVHADGVQAIVDAIMQAPGQVTLLCIGPVPNIAEALRREPRIAPKTRFVGMYGSVRLGYGGSPTVAAEYNVIRDVRACQAVFSAPWAEMTFTPVDTCGLVQLKGEKYKAVCESADPLTRTVIENYRMWLQGQPDEMSSILFDTVAAYLVFADDMLVMENLGIRVTDDGFTRIDPKARAMRVATEWKDLGAFEDFLVHRLAGNVKTSPKTE